MLGPSKSVATPVSDPQKCITFGGSDMYPTKLQTYKESKKLPGDVLIPMQDYKLQSTSIKHSKESYINSS